MLTEKYYQDLARSIQETSDMLNEAKKFLSSYEINCLTTKLFIDADRMKQHQEDVANQFMSLAIAVLEARSSKTI